MSERLPLDIINSLSDYGVFERVILSPAHVDGMIFAVAATPEIPMPEQWMPWLIQSSGSQLIDKDVDILADTLMDGLRAHLSFMRNEKSPLSKDLLTPIDTNDGPRPTVELINWLNGLLQIHQRVEPIWQNAWDRLSKQAVLQDGEPNSESPDARLSRCLKLFSTLANVELALKYRTPEQAEDLSNNLPLLIKQLPSILTDYTQIAGELANALPNQFETFVKALE